MKTFIYSKKTSKKIATINKVARVKHISEKSEIVFITESGEEFSFDTSRIKTVTYQN